MKWQITDPTQAVLLIGLCVLVFTLLQIVTLYWLGRRRPEWLKLQRDHALVGILIGLPVSGMAFLPLQSGTYLFLFALYLLVSSWFACHLAFRLAVRRNNRR
jgi:hypothetical protein